MWLDAIAAGPSRDSARPMGLMAVALAATVLALAPAPAWAALDPDDDPDDEVITYSADVAVILQENCQVCHQPGSIGPMSLMSYEEVRPWAPMIREQVSDRNMPPFHLDTDLGIQDLKDDWRLSDEEIQTIVAWVDQGAPEGDPSNLPPPVDWPDYREWRLEDRLGEPDMVLSSAEFSIPAEGGDLWWKPVQPIPVEEGRWLRAVEVKPSVPAGRQVVHHAVPSLRVPNDDGELESAGVLSEFAMGKVGEMFPEDVGRWVPEGSYISWDIHYYPVGTEFEDDQVELGLWFHPEGYEPPYEQKLENLGLQGDLAIPPHGTAMTQGFHRFDHPVRIDSFQAHGHVHLTNMTMEAIFPDGEREMLASTRFNARWHHSYIYEDDVAPLLPTGTVIVLTGWYENTEDNPLATDPNVWVGRGARTTDEMSHTWIGITHLDEEGYERLAEEREAEEADPMADE